MTGVLLVLISTTQLAAGIQAVQDPWVPIATERAQKYAAAIQAAADRYQVDPFELIGVARVESLFRARDVGPDGKDCGIMQTRTTVSRYSCRRLKNYRLGFLEGARELAAVAKSCFGRPDFDRCRFNRYHGGTRSVPHGLHVPYWLRVMCFAEAARAGEAGGGCRDVRARRGIARAATRPSRGGRGATVIAQR